MSGGCLNYVYSQVREAAETTQHSHRPEIQAFSAHLFKVSDALHNLEWFLSGDSSEETAIEAIMKVISPQDVLKTTIENAKQARDDLEKYLFSVTREG